MGASASRFLARRRRRRRRRKRRVQLRRGNLYLSISSCINLSVRLLSESPTNQPVPNRERANSHTNFWVLPPQARTILILLQQAHTHTNLQVNFSSLKRSPSHLVEGALC